MESVSEVNGSQAQLWLTGKVIEPRSPNIPTIDFKATLIPNRKRI